MNELIIAVVIAVVGGCLGMLQGLVIYILNGQGKKISQICQDNRADHKELREEAKSLESKVEKCEYRITVVEGKIQ
jgi:hypothetical protein